MTAIFRLTAKFKGDEILIYAKCPATDDDLSEALLDYDRFKNDTRYSDWKAEMCEGTLEDYGINVTSVVKEYQLD